MTKVSKNSYALALALIFGISYQASPQSATAIAVAPQYDTTHVYVSPADVDSFVKCFLGTFGGASTNQVVATVTPTPSSTTSQLLQTPNRTVSLFGFTTPIPYPFGAERTGLLVTDLDDAVKRAEAAGAELWWRHSPIQLVVTLSFDFRRSHDPTVLAYDKTLVCSLRFCTGEPSLYLSGWRRCICKELCRVQRWSHCSRRC